MRTTHLPQSNPNPAVTTHLKLLARIQQWAPHGLGFIHSRILRCGAKIIIDELPRPAVLLEYAGFSYAGTYRGRGFHRGKIHRFVLWEFDFTRLHWRELACAQSDGKDSSWDAALMHRAALALNGGRPPTPEPALAVAERIVRTLDDELEALPPDCRPAVLGAIEPEIAGRIAAYLP